jgi:hypothetical protein
MRLTSAGNIGIGTTNPSSRLSINQAGTDVSNGLWLYSGDNAATGGIALFKGGSLLGSIQSLGGNSLLNFITNASGTNFERMRITSTGDVGIGTTSPAQKLEVVGNVKARDFVLSDSSNVEKARIVYDETSQSIKFTYS